MDQSEFERCVVELRAPRSVLDHPGMTTIEEKVALYNLARHHYRGHGAIIDAGIFLGASTNAFATGIRDSDVETTAISPPIYSYDRMTWAGGGFDRHLNHPMVATALNGRAPEKGSSFMPLIRTLLAPHLDLIEFRVGDIAKVEPVGIPIEIAFYDVLKARASDWAAFRAFAPYFIPGHTIVVQQDYFYWGGHDNKIRQEYLEDHFEFWGAIGCSAFFRVIKPFDPSAFVSDPLETFTLETKRALLHKAISRTKAPTYKAYTRLSEGYLLLEHEQIEAARAVVNQVDQDVAPFISRRLRKEIKSLRVAISQARHAHRPKPLAHRPPPISLGNFMDRSAFQRCIIDAEDPPRNVLDHPGMTTDGEKAALYNLARHYYRGDGVIIDAGIFLGASTNAFAAGLRSNPRALEKLQSTSQRPIKSYDVAIWVESFDRFLTSQPVRDAFGTSQPRHGESFLPALDILLQDSRDLVEFRIGDITKVVTEQRPIEIAFYDCLKNFRRDRAAFLAFAPSYIPGRTVVIQQDYFFWGACANKVRQEYLSEYFEFLGAVSSSAFFRLVKPIPQHLFDRDPVKSLSVDDKRALIAQAARRSPDRLFQAYTELSEASLMMSEKDFAEARYILNRVSRDYADVMSRRSRRKIANLWQKLDAAESCQ